MRAMLTAALLLVSALGFAQQPPNCPLGTSVVAADSTAWICRGPNIAPLQVSTGGGEAVPAGSILLIKSGTCPTGYTEDADFNGRTVIGTLAANSNVGTTGGTDLITPAGANSAPTFTGTAWSAPAISWPAGVPSLTMNSFSAVINHTHTVTVTDPGHTHTQASQTATTGSISSWEHGAIDTSSAATETLPTGSSTTGITASTANPAGGVASITPTGSIAWPAGVPTIGAYTPAGSVSAPTFTGTQFDNRSAYLRVIACRKT